MPGKVGEEKVRKEERGDGEESKGGSQEWSGEDGVGREDGGSGHHPANSHGSLAQGLAR